MTPLPVQYHLEIYEESFINDPCVAQRADTPFLAFSVGDLFDPRCIVNGTHNCPDGNWWVIKSIVHRVWEIDGSHAAHQIGLCVVPVKSPYAS